MDVFLEVAKWLAIILGVFSAPLMIWMFISALVGLKKPKALVRIEDRLHSFAVIICARNEEGVIGNLLKSLKKQDYIGEHHVFVVADNCTDDTAKAAEREGATVFVRNDPGRRGKGYALEYGINHILRGYEGKYDAMCVFDADNLVSRDFLTEMNSALCSGADAAQGYRDTKNIHDSWLSEAYSVYWLMMQRFYHHPRHIMGLSSLVGGTGFAFKTAMLGGEWHTQSIAEDMEFSIGKILEGYKIIPARAARFYDEQPTSFGVSMKQRLRWIVGGLQCIRLCMRPIVKSVAGGNLKALDLAWYLLLMVTTGLAIPLNVLTIITLTMTPELQPYALPLILAGAAAMWGGAMLVAYLTLKLEKRDVKSMIRSIFCYPVYMFTTMMVAFAALVRPKTEWVPIRHTSVRRIEDLE